MTRVAGCPPDRVTYNLMVVDHRATGSPDRLFHALADPTRRDIVALVLAGEHSVSQLARRFPMSFAAVQKHVAVLERAGLVVKQRRGREQRVTGNVVALSRAQRALDELEAVWRHRVGRIGQILADGEPAARDGDRPDETPDGPGGSTNRTGSPKATRIDPTTEVDPEVDA